MSDYTKLAKEVVKIAKTKRDKKPSSFDTEGKVNRIDRDNKIAWVKFAEGEDETPVQMTMDVVPGDRVRIRESGHKAWIAGNITHPPTDATGAVNYVSKIVKGMEARMDSGEFKGDPGEPGEPGVSVGKVEIQHCLASARAIPEGSEFEDIQETEWQDELPEYPETGTHYYWRRTVTYLEDGSIVYGDPEFDMEAQTSYESIGVARAAQSAAEDANTAAQAAASEAQDASDAASAAQDAAETARDEAIAEAEAATGIAEQAAADAAQASSDVANQKKYFWHDNTGAHVSETENSTAIGASANIYSNVVALKKDGKLMASFGQDSLNFYDAASTLATLAAYTKAGITLYANGYRTTNFTNSAITFWDPTDTTNAGTANQRIEAQFTKNSSMFYSGGYMAASFGSNSLNFYSAESTNKQIAVYSKSGITFYKDGYRSTSFTNSSVTFWDPTDTANAGTTSQRMQALFSNTSASFYAEGKIISNFAKNALNFYDGTNASASTNDLLAAYTNSGIELYTKTSSSANSTKTASFTNSGITFWNPSDNSKKEAIFGSSGIELYSGGTKALSITSANSVNSITFADSFKAKIGNSSRYLEWTGSALNLVTDSLKIGTKNALKVDDNISNLNNDSLYQTQSQVSAAVSGKSDKTATLSTTVPIYYRKESINPPTPTKNTSIGTSDNTSDAWEYVMPIPKKNCTFYICEKYVPISGDPTFSTVRSFSNATYVGKWCHANNATQIDGDAIYANSITAGKLDAANIAVGSFKKDGTYSTGKYASFTSGSTGQDGAYHVSYATVNSWANKANDTWGNITSFSGQPGDLISVPIVITDHNDAFARMDCRVISYANNVLTTDNYGLILGEDTSRYVTYIDSTNGVRVYSSTGSPNSYAQMNSNAFEIYKNVSNAPTLVASFGASAQIGQSSSNHLLINSSAISFYKDANYRSFWISHTASSILKQCIINNYSIEGDSTKSKNEITISSGKISSSSPDTASIRLRSTSTAPYYGEVRIFGGASDGYVEIEPKLIIDGHSSEVGSIITATNTKSIATTSSFVTSGCSLTIPAGSWVICYGASWEEDSTTTSGRRAVELYTSSYVSYTRIVTPAGISSDIQQRGAFPVNRSSSTTYYVYVLQNSGKSISCTANIYAIRVA